MSRLQKIERKRGKRLRHRANREARVMREAAMRAARRLQGGTLPPGVFTLKEINDIFEKWRRITSIPPSPADQTSAFLPFIVEASS